MTIAVCIKINDGVVLASDSATTILGVPGPGQPLVAINVYNNANKIFNLRKGFPIGAITWGAGGVGTASVSTLIKDLRSRFTGKDEKHKEWALNRKTYTVEGVAGKLKEFIFDEMYEPAYRDYQFQKPAMGFIVAGYSANSDMAEEFQIDIQNGVCTGPRRLRTKEEAGMAWSGEPEALNRLILGYSLAFPPLLQAELKVNAAQMAQAMTNVQQKTQIAFIVPAMPLQDAIDLGEFMVDVTKNFSRFKPGATTVGGPIEVAAISKHEGFRWVRRKHYFDRELNPEIDKDDEHLRDEEKKNERA